MANLDIVALLKLAAKLWSERLVPTGFLRSCPRSAYPTIVTILSALQIESAEGGVVKRAEVVEGRSIGILVETLVGAGEFGVRCHLVDMRRACAHGLLRVLEDASAESGELGSAETDSFRYVGDSDAAIPQRGLDQHAQLIARAAADRKYGLD